MSGATKQEPVGVFINVNQSSAWADKPNYVQIRDEDVWSRNWDRFYLYAAPVAAQAEPLIRQLREALNAMLAEFGLDEDASNKATFEQAYAALAASTQPGAKP